MGIVARIFRGLRNDLAVNDEKAWNPSLWRLFIGNNASGVDVNEFTALNYSAVFCAINLISSFCSMLPLRLIVEKGGRKRPATRKKIYRVMHTRWNEYMTAHVGREVMTAHILGWGNGYAEKVRNGLGEIVELWPIPPNRCCPFLDSDRKLKYEITVGNEKIILDREKVLHIPGPGFDGFTGYSVIGLARQNIGLAMALEKFGAQFFSNGTNPGMVVSHQGKLSEQGSKNLRASLTEKYSGLGNAHRLMLLEEGMKVEQIGINPDDSQFLESRQFQITDIARWFNLPPHKLKDMTKSSFNNIESEQISFVMESILPWLIRLETNYDMQLLPERDQENGYYFKHNVEGMLRGNSKSRGEFYKTLWGIGAMNGDEIREKEDLDPIPGGKGKMYFVPVNMAPLDSFKNDREVPTDDSDAPPEDGNDEQPASGRKQKGPAAQ